MHHDWALCTRERTHARTPLPPPLGEKPTPPLVRYLGNVLPAAVFGMLVVYCLKDVSLLSGTHGLPDGIAIAITALLHLKFRQMLLSIGGGTAVYMLLVQFVFTA